MASVTVKMRDGSVREFKERGRPGGSYSMHLRYEIGFVVVTDEWNEETAIPTELVAEVVKERDRSW